MPDNEGNLLRQERATVDNTNAALGEVAPLGWDDPPMASDAQREAPVEQREITARRIAEQAAKRAAAEGH